LLFTFICFGRFHISAAERTSYTSGRGQKLFTKGVGVRAASAQRKMKVKNEPKIVYVTSTNKNKEAKNGGGYRILAKKARETLRAMEALKSAMESAARKLAAQLSQNQIEPMLRKIKELEGYAGGCAKEIWIWAKKAK
jgi:hypothetical protein